MAGTSPLRHRHDGSSPLPLGMDYSPAPSKWTGPNSVWPHDPRTGWSYCVMIPSWTNLQDGKSSDSHIANPIVFYRVQVGIQSPQGISTSRKVLRRFSDFLKLHASLKRAFPKKALPMSPPKNSTLWMKANENFLEERRLALVDWLGRLLSDINVSRSAPVAAFFELEAAARIAMTGIREAQLSTNISSDPSMKSGLSSAASVASETELGSDTSFDVQGVEIPKVSYNQCVDMDLESLDEPMRIRQEPLEYGVSSSAKSVYAQRLPADMSEKLSFRDGDMALDADSTETNINITRKLHSDVSDPEGMAKGWHLRRSSVDSIASEISSAKGSDFSFAATADGLESSQLDIFRNTSNHLESFSAELLKGVQASLPSDQRGNVKRVLTNLHRRLNTAKVDMEDMITRLTQETTVKEFLAAKVRDLEGELDSSRRKSKDMLQRAITMEQENLNNLQWELEETRASLTSANDQVHTQEEARIAAEEKTKIAEMERDQAKLEVLELKEKLENLQKEKEASESKTKSEIKVLAREIRTLRKSQPELKEEMESIIKEKNKLEVLIQNERQKQEQQRLDRAKFLHEVANLRKRLQECSIEYMAKQDEKSISKNAAVKDVMDLLMTSDNRIGLLAAEAQLLAEEKEEDKTIYQSFAKDDGVNGVFTRSSMPNDQDLLNERALRKMLAEIFMDNVQLYKVVNSMTLNAAVMDAKSERIAEHDEAPARKNSVLNRLL